jgi:8-oxo-dGTP pyrophosphatase MutT (NUDIX family)
LTRDSDEYLEIDTDRWRFQPRVAAVCVWRDHVLVQRAIDGEFWVLPGGRVLPFEATPQALRRTLRWEIGQDVTVHGLLWVMEYATTVAGRGFHELGFYFAVDLPADSPFLDLTGDHAGVERGRDLVLRWVPLADVPDLPIVPEFLRRSLGDRPDSPRHVVAMARSE